MVYHVMFILSKISVILKEKVELNYLILYKLMQNHSQFYVPWTDRLSNLFQV